MKMLLHCFLLLSSASSLSQTGGDEQIIASESVSGNGESCDKSINGKSNTCHKSISGDGDSCDKSEEVQLQGVDSCQRKDTEEEKIVGEKEKKKMEWQELDWASYQALDITPTDREEPTARSTIAAKHNVKFAKLIGQTVKAKTFMNLFHFQVCLGRSCQLRSCPESKCAGVARPRL